MIFEGTGNYFLLLFLVFFIVLLTVKICEYHIFKSAKLPAWKAFIPFYNRMMLTDLLDLKRSIFYKTFIPIGNLYYYYIIIGKLLEAYNLDKKEAIYFILIPMYKFPELVFKHPQFMLHMYDETEEFLLNQKSLYEKDVEEVKEIEKEEKVVGQVGYNQMPEENDTVFSNSALIPDERKETIVEAKTEEVKEEKPINVNDSKPKVCPNCGTKLEPTAKVCFFCGTNV